MAVSIVPPAQELSPLSPAPPVLVYNCIDGDNRVGENISQANTLRRILHWVEFVLDAQKDALLGDTFKSFDILKF